MVVGARDDWALVNERHERDRPELLRDSTVHCLVTAGDPDVGGAGRGVPDPTAPRWSAIIRKVDSQPLGRLPPAARERSLGRHYGPGSPLERFLHAGGRVLRLGADLDTVTLLHYRGVLGAASFETARPPPPIVDGHEGP